MNNSTKVSSGYKNDYPVFAILNIFLLIVIMNKLNNNFNPAPATIFD